MSLEDKIKEQYQKRVEKSHLYNHSLSYVLLAEEERSVGIKNFIADFFYSKNINNLRVLEIGAGHGNNYKAFVDVGIPLLNIEFNELLPERISHLKSHFPNNVLYEGDIAEIEIREKFDIIFQSTVFSSVLDEVAREKIAKKLLGLLTKDGIILWYDFIFNNPSNKDVKKVSISTIKRLFPNCYVNAKKITLAPPIGRRVGKFYKLFNFPFLRSHVLAVIKRNEQKS